MQFSPINSLYRYEDTSNIQSVSPLVSTCSTYYPSIISARNTDEIPLTLDLNQDVVTNEDLFHSSTELNTHLHAQLQHENNQRNFWRVFQGDVTEDLFKEKILDCIKNNWKFDPSLKQNLSNPILEIRKDIQYKLLLDMLFQFKFTHFINNIVIEIFKFIQTENQINESSSLGELEIIIAKHDVKNEISNKLSFFFNIVYKDYFNRKNQVLSQDALIELMPLLTDELQQAEKENVESKIDSFLYAITLPKFESLFTEEIRLGSKEFNENDDINSIIQCNDSIDMHSHLITNDSNLQSMSNTDTPQRSNTKTMLQKLDVHPVTNTNNEALQKNNKLSDERMLQSLLVSIFEENYEHYEQILFKAYKENNPLKDKYLALTMLAVEVAKGCLQIKTKIAKFSFLELAKDLAPQNLPQIKGFFYKNLADILTNFSNYYQLIEELQPEKDQVTTIISTKEMKKTHLKIVMTIQEIKKQFFYSKRKYNNILNKKQITKTIMAQKMRLYLTEQRSIEIFQERFINLSIDKINEIIFSSQPFLQPEDNTDLENATKALQAKFESDEAIKLEFLLANIFTVPFYCDEQVLYKVYEEDHPLKDEYLSLMLLALNANKMCLQIKIKIAQLDHFARVQSKNREQDKNAQTRSMKIIKTVLYKELTEFFANSSSYYQLMEELKPLEIQVTKKISTRKMKKIDTNLIDPIRALQIKIRRAQQFYNTIQIEQQISEKQIIQNLFHYLTEKEVIKTLRETFLALSDQKIKEIIASTKITPQVETNTENTLDILQNRSELEESLILESMLVNIFKNSFYYNEQLLFNACINNNESKDDLSALMISSMQVKETSLKIKTRIIQLLHLEQKEDSLESHISSVKSYLYRDLSELFICSSNYNLLMDKLNLLNVQAQSSPNMSPKQVILIDKSVAEPIRLKKKQLRATQKYFNSTNRDRPIKESQIIQSMLVYLSEQKAISTFKKNFTFLTEDKIKEIITRSVLLIANSQNNKAIETSLNKQLNQGIQGDLAPPLAKKMCTRKSQASASLSKAPPESVAFQSFSQASRLRFNSLHSETLTARESSPSESSESTQLHFPSQSVKLTLTQEETQFANACQINTVSADISYSDPFFELFDQEGLSEDLAIPAIEPIENE